jgi:outer membrane biosynthesis protein TonB
VASRSPIRRSSPTARSVDRAARSLSDSLGDIASASLDGGDGGDGGGRGGGHGRGIGRGVGEGLGDRASAGERLPSVPAAPKASKARPPKLVYPTRERDASEGELYLARVTIDTDGYVVGARLLHSAGPKDTDASTMIFKFRYAPALDDDGHAIKATIEQPFLVQ